MAATDIYSCDAGSFKFGDECYLCPAGTFSQGSIQQFCSLSPPGSYVSQSNSSEYLPCDYAVFNGAVSCNNGHNYCDAGYYYESGSCHAAPVGYYVPLPGSGTYYACPPGSYSFENASIGCTNVAKGEFNPFAASSLSTVGSCIYSLEYEGAITCQEEYEFVVPILTTSLVNTSRGLVNPAFVAISSSASVLYVTDSGNEVVREIITATGYMSTFAGRIGVANYIDGTGTVAAFSNPQGIAADSTGMLYVADTDNNRIRRIATSSRLVTTVAGSSTTGLKDGIGTNANFAGPMGIAVDSSRTLYVSDNGAVIRRISFTGVVTTVAGSIASDDSSSFTDGLGTNAHFNSPIGLTVSTNGVVYIADTGFQLIRSMDPNRGYEVKTVVGNGESSYGDGAGTNVGANTPVGIVMDSAGNLYFTSTGYGIVRKMETTGVVTTLVGSTQSNQAADGIGTNAQLEQPQGIVVDSTGRLYVVSTYDGSVRKLDLINSTCPDGTFFNNHFCTTTPGGYFMPADVESSVVYACPAGYYTPDTGSHICIATPVGNFTPTAGQNLYYPCPNNTYGLGAAAECTPESVYPTSFPTHEPIIHKHRLQMWIFILIGVLGSIIACILLSVLCYYRCWRDSDEEHRQHAKRHEIEFGVEGNTTIQVHAVSDYVSLRHQRQHDNDTVAEPSTKNVLPRPPSNNNLVASEVNPNAVNHGGHWSSPPQRVTIAADRSKVNAPQGYLPVPAQSLNVSRHSDAGGGSLHGGSTHDLMSLHSNQGGQHGHGGYGQQHAQHLPPRHGQQGAQRRPSNASYVSSAVDDDQSIARSIPTIADDIEMILHQSNIGGGSNPNSRANSRSGSPTGSHAPANAYRGATHAAAPAGSVVGIGAPQPRRLASPAPANPHRSPSPGGAYQRMPTEQSFSSGGGGASLYSSAPTALGYNRAPASSPALNYGAAPVRTHSPSVGGGSDHGGGGGYYEFDNPQTFYASPIEQQQHRGVRTPTPPRQPQYAATSPQYPSQQQQYHQQPQQRRGGDNSSYASTPPMPPKQKSGGGSGYSTPTPAGHYNPNASSQQHAANLSAQAIAQLQMRSSNSRSPSQSSVASGHHSNL